MTAQQSGSIWRADFGEVADDGRIGRAVGFFDPLPEVDSIGCVAPAAASRI